MASTRAMRTRAAWGVLVIVLVTALIWIAGLTVAGSRLDTLPRMILTADAEPLRLAKTLKHSGHVSTIAFSPDGRYLTAGGLLERAVSIWDVPSGALVRTLVPEAGGVTALAWSPDGRLLASGRNFVRLIKNRIAITVWDARTGTVAHDLRGPFEADDGSNDVEALAFDPRGTRLASAHFGGAVAVHDVTSGALVHTISGHVALGQAVAYSPDGRYLATSGEPRRAPIEILDGRTGDRVRSLVADTGSQGRLVFSPDGRFIASSGSQTPAITIWDVEAGHPLGSPLWGHVGPVMAVAYSPDGKWLASGSGGDSIKLWATPSRLLAASLPVGQRAGRSLGFSADGRYLASTDGDVVKLWDFRAAVPGLLKRLGEKGS